MEIRNRLDCLPDRKQLALPMGEKDLAQICEVVEGSAQEKLTDAKEDFYDLDLQIRDNGRPVGKQQIPSWPYGCDTDPCNGTGTYSTSCNGTCHSDCK